MKIITAFMLTFLAFKDANGSAKKGICVGPGSYLCNDTHAFNGVSWWYDWGAWEYSHKHHHCTNKPTGEYVPMFWGEKSITRDSVPAGSHYVLGFNEPDHTDQSHMTPEKVAQLWPALERKAHGHKLISPALAGCDNTKHCISWFTEFFKACKNCRVDALAVHSYSCNAAHVVDAIKTISQHFNKKVWLTEFACASGKTEAQQLHFMSQILPKLEASPFVEKYAWFETRLAKNGSFINSSINLLDSHTSTLTKLGKFYDSYKYSGVIG